MQEQRGFASDNNAGVHPRILEVLKEVNVGHVVAYGGDKFTEKVAATFSEEFGHDAQIFFVFNGTAANVLSLQSMTKPYQAIICGAQAHINVDECGAPEKFTGCKLVTIASPDGKLTVEMIRGQLKGIGDQHHVQPKVVSITQSTELGTVYTPEEIKKIAEFCHGQNLYLHMDGARLSNAAAALGVELREITSDCGVDVLSFGGTKIGLLGAEAVVFFRKDLAEEFKFIRKQGMQLASKMRFLSAQFEVLLREKLWKKNALAANQMAKLMAEKLAGLDGIQITQKVQANGLFVRMPNTVIAEVQKKYFFYVWDTENSLTTSVVRLMTSFDTKSEDIDGFVQCLKAHL